MAHFTDRDAACIFRIWMFSFSQASLFSVRIGLEMITQINLDPDLFANKGKRLTARWWRPLGGDHWITQWSVLDKITSQGEQRSILQGLDCTFESIHCIFRSWAMHVFSIKVICPRGRKLTISLHLTLSCGITFVLTDKQLFPKNIYIFSSEKSSESDISLKFSPIFQIL